MLAEGGKIQWISTRKTSGDEWKGFTKSFCVDKRIKRAVFRLQSDAICGVYINGEFITSGTGHYAERVTAHEITSRLNMGENTVRLMLGARYFPWGGEEAKYLRGFWYSNLAFELEIEYEDGSCAYLPTDDTWESDGGRAQREVRLSYFVGLSASFLAVSNSFVLVIIFLIIRITSFDDVLCCFRLRLAFCEGVLPRFGKLNRNIPTELFLELLRFLLACVIACMR